MVWEALYSCAAADALMNKKLPGYVKSFMPSSPSNVLFSGLRQEYQSAYDSHDSRARNMIIQAIDVFNDKLRRNEKPNALPLYYAAFLLHAAGVIFPSKLVWVTIIDLTSGLHQRYTGFIRRNQRLQSPRGVHYRVSSSDRGRLCVSRKE
jgi:hypothetical protein